MRYTSQITKKIQKQTPEKAKKAKTKKSTKISETYGVLTWSPKHFFSKHLLFSGIGRGEVHPQTWDPNGLVGYEMDTKCHMRFIHPKAQRSQRSFLEITRGYLNFPRHMILIQGCFLHKSTTQVLAERAAFLDGSKAKACCTTFAGRAVKKQVKSQGFMVIHGDLC